MGFKVSILVTGRSFTGPKRQSVSLFISNSITELFVQSFGYLVNKSCDW
jgi:hypothetical protein